MSDSDFDPLPLETALAQLVEGQPPLAPTMVLFKAFRESCGALLTPEQTAGVPREDWRGVLIYLVSRFLEDLQGPVPEEPADPHARARARLGDAFLHALRYESWDDTRDALVSLANYMLQADHEKVVAHRENPQAQFAEVVEALVTPNPKPETIH
jgi:hypothetical protein